MEFQQSAYESPEIVDYGDLVELTAGHACGHSLDSAFQTGTYADHPSFSNG